MNHCFHYGGHRDCVDMGMGSDQCCDSSDMATGIVCVCDGMGMGTDLEVGKFVHGYLMFLQSQRPYLSR